MVDYILQRSDIVVDDFMESLPRRKLNAIIRDNLETMRSALPIKTGKLSKSLKATIVNGRIMVYIPARIYYAQYVNEKPATMGYFDKAYDAFFKPGFLTDISALQLSEARQKKSAEQMAKAAEDAAKRKESEITDYAPDLTDYLRNRLISAKSQFEAEEAARLRAAKKKIEANNLVIPSINP
jgi:hypothetical protein